MSEAEVDVQRGRTVLRRLLSLWSLLAAIAVCLGVFALVHIVRCRQEQYVIAQLQQINDGRTFNLLYSNPFNIGDGPGEMELAIDGRRVWLRDLIGVDPFKTVTSLTIYAPGNSFSYGSNDNGEIVIESTYRSGVSGQELELIGQLKNLKALHLEANPVEDEDVESLASLSRLENLNLSNTQVSDDAMAAIAKLPRLRTLSISHTHAGNEGIARLAEIMALEELDVTMTRVTPDGVRELKRHLPACKVIQ